MKPPWGKRPFDERAINMTLLSLAIRRIDRVKSGVRVAATEWQRIAPIVVLALLLSLPTSARAQSLEPDAKLVAAIDKAVQKDGIHADAPGVAVMIHQPGKFLFQKGYGLANLKTKQPISPKTLFELASVSKTF